MACGLVFMTVVLFYYCIEASRHGFEFTDETYYLINMQSPHLYNSVVSKFGAVYHPLYKFLGGDIFLLRFANSLLRYSLSFILVWILLIEEIRAFGRNYIALAVVSSVAAVSFMQNLLYRGWLGATPSYNSLNFEALLVCMIGVLLATSVNSRKKYFGMVVSGCGSALCFLAKPPAAALLLCCISCYFFLVSKERLKTLCIIYAAFLITLFISAWMVSGGVYEYVTGITEGYYDTLSWRAGHELLPNLKRFLNFPKISLKDILTLGIAACFLMFFIFCQKIRSASVFATVFACYTFVLLFRFYVRIPSILMANHLCVILIVFFLCATFIVCRQEFIIRPSAWALPLLFFVVPIVYVFGTNTDYSQGMIQVLIFPVVSVIAAFKLLPVERLWGLLTPFAMGVLMFVGVNIAHSQDKPYRQTAPLYAQRTSVHIGGGLLETSEDVVRNIENMRAAALRGGFVAGTPIIDLLGFGPGILYVLDAEALGTPWVLGGLKGRLDFATRVFQRVPREKLLRAWILTNHRSKHGIPDEIFAQLDLDFPSSYERRATIKYFNLGNIYLYAPKSVHP